MYILEIIYHIHFVLNTKLKKKKKIASCKNDNIAHIYIKNALILYGGSVCVPSQT